MFTLYAILYSPKQLSKTFPFHVENCLQSPWHISQSEAQLVLPLSMDILASTLKWGGCYASDQRYVQENSSIHSPSLGTQSLCCEETFTDFAALSTKSQHQPPDVMTTKTLLNDINPQSPSCCHSNSLAEVLIFTETSLLQQIHVYQRRIKPYNSTDTLLGWMWN